MNVLWFTNTPSNYSAEVVGYNGGGWISSLESEIRNIEGIRLALCFKDKKQLPKIERNNVCYYPVQDEYTKSVFRKAERILWNSERLLHKNMKKYLEVIDDFSPDVINVFGTEEEFGLIAAYTKIPVVIHLQGIINPCLNAFFPPGVSLSNYLKEFKIGSALKRWKEYMFYKQRCKQEITIIKNNRFFVGRTEWDKMIISVYNSNASYFHVDEVLRLPFYNKSERIKTSKAIITTTISSALYKGFDVIIKCARLLKDEFDLPFEWHVFGNVDETESKRIINKNTLSENVYIRGIVSADVLKEALLKSSVYVHSSYIDNSPNSLCEAQMMGCPVIGQYVGGVPSLIENGVDGFLVPANDPYGMAYYIRLLIENDCLNEEMGKLSYERAITRHNKEAIVNNLTSLYRKLSLK